jgi:hypothetical protein
MNLSGKVGRAMQKEKRWYNVGGGPTCEFEWGRERVCVVDVRWDGSA